MTEKLKIVFGMLKNIIGKGENPGYQHFLHFLQCFQKASSKRVFNPLPDNKILDWSKLKQIADNILKCIQNEKYVI